MFEKQKASAVVDVDEDITLEAFVALGGQVQHPHSCAVSQSPLPQTQSTDSSRHMLFYRMRCILLTLRGEQADKGGTISVEKLANTLKVTFLYGSNGRNVQVGICC